MPRKSKEPKEAKLKSPKGGKPSVAAVSTAMKGPRTAPRERQGTSDKSMKGFGGGKVVNRSLKK